MMATMKGPLIFALCLQLILAAAAAIAVAAIVVVSLVLFVLLLCCFVYCVAGVSAVTLAELEAELAGEVEEEPDWNLPPHLQEYG
jgi:hypothetical protein